MEEAGFKILEKSIDYGLSYAILLFVIYGMYKYFTSKEKAKEDIINAKDKVIKELQSERADEQRELIETFTNLKTAIHLLSEEHKSYRQQTPKLITDTADAIVSKIENIILKNKNV